MRDHTPTMPRLAAAGESASAPVRAPDRREVQDAFKRAAHLAILHHSSVRAEARLLGVDESDLRKKLDEGQCSHIQAAELELLSASVRRECLDYLLSRCGMAAGAVPEPASVPASLHAAEGAVVKAHGDEQEAAWRALADGQVTPGEARGWLVRLREALARSRDLEQRLILVAEERQGPGVAVEAVGRAARGGRRDG